jgi:curved DNA-binding protein CbpA
MSNFYRLLGVSPHADDAQIKIAYRQLAMRLHPDLNAGDTGAEQRFKDINRAYATLRDPSARALYDRERARQCWRSPIMTMSACFVLTVSSGLLVVAWIRVEARNHTPREVAPVVSELEKLPSSGTWR